MDGFDEQGNVLDTRVGEDIAPPDTEVKIIEPEPPKPKKAKKKKVKEPYSGPPAQVTIGTVDHPATL